MSWNATNSTTHEPDPNGANTLSAGSAAFIIFALLFGSMTQLPGSLVVSECNRVWRLSPFLSLAECVVILSRTVYPLFRTLSYRIRRLVLPATHKWHPDPETENRSHDLKIHAYALLAERLGNSRKYNYWMRMQRKQAVPTLEDIVSLLDEVSNLERGATLRPVVIVPMVLQLFKVVFVDAGFLEVKLLAYLYFFSWFSAEVQLLMVHGEKLDTREMLEAEKILLLNVATTEIARARQPENREVLTLPPSSRVSEQTQALLEHVVGRENVPSHRVSFRRGRESLKTMRGNPGNRFYLLLVETAGSAFESILQNIALCIAIQDKLPGWLWWIMFMSTYLFVPYFIDQLIGVVISATAKAFINVSINETAACRDWIALKSLVFIVIFYAWLYSADGTNKPAWLDWLG